MSCSACVERGKIWEGSDPICGFETGTFRTGNWNCATLNALRDASYVTHANENKVGVIPHHKEGDFILLLWYKNRGATMQAIYWADEGPPTPLTLAQAESVLKQV